MAKAEKTPVDAVSAIPLHVELQAAADKAFADGDHASHGVLAGIDMAIIDLKNRLTAFEQNVSDDARAMIEKIKAAL